MKSPVSIRPMPVYQAIATAVDARLRCIERGNTEWQCKHTESIQQIVISCLPSGSGIDNGTKIDMHASQPDKLVFDVSFHHMDESGGYDGWTEHQVIVTPSLIFGINLRITGPNRNDIKEYLHDCYHTALTEMLEANEYQTANS